MDKLKMKKAFSFVLLNGIATLIVVFLVKKVRADLSIFTFFHYIEEDTKKFVLYFMLIFLVFLSTGKFQFKLFNQLSEKYPRVLTLLKMIGVMFVSWAASFFVNYYFQYFQNLKDPVATILWIDGNEKIFYAGIYYLFFLFLFMYSFIGNLYISTLITTAILCVLGFINYNKLNLRVEPLYPFDYKQIGQMKEVIPMISDYISVTQIIIVVLLFLSVFAFAWFLPKMKISLWLRGLIFLISVTMIYSYTYFPKTFMKSFVEKHDVAIVKWNQIDNYEVNGFLFGFISNLHNKTFEKPEGYSKQKVLETAQKYVKDNKTGSGQSKQTPNIVFLMSESFWDPSKLNLNFSGDPIPNLRQLMSEYSSGQILSPAFGGATANVEFEALTGFSNAFLQFGAVPYQDFIDNKAFIPTIVSDLENKGYDTMAIHPFNRVFYKRDVVYKTFGINEFLDQETMKNKGRTPGGIISDQSLTNEILDNIKKQEKPLFIHAVSMQNHMPYNQGAYEENKIKITGLSPESTATLEVYTEGIRQADEALQSLVNTLETFDEPTIVVFWGDHLPILGQDMGIYKEANYDDSNADTKERMISETPLLIYSNFKTKQLKLNTISPYYLAPIVYELSGMESPPFHHLLNQLRQEIPAQKAKLTIGNNQQPLKKQTKKQKQLLEDYRLIEYDILMGKQYSKEVLYND